MVARVSGIAKAGRVLVWKVTLECGVVSAENAARVAGDKLGLPGRTGLACRLVGVRLKASSTHAGRGGRGEGRHASGTLFTRSVACAGFDFTHQACFAQQGGGVAEVARLARTVQDRRGA